MIMVCLIYNDNDFLNYNDDDDNGNNSDNDNDTVDLKSFCNALFNSNDHANVNFNDYIKVNGLWIMYNGLWIMDYG